MTTTKDTLLLAFPQKKKYTAVFSATLIVLLIRQHVSYQSKGNVAFRLSKMHKKSRNSAASEVLTSHRHCNGEILRPKVKAKSICSQLSFVKNG